jgi:Homeodomain-like domain
MAGKRYIVRLSEDERSRLTKVIRADKGVPPKKRMRAQILLKVDEGEHGPGWTDEQTARALEVHVNSVQAVRQQLVTEGFEQALNRKKQRRPSRVPIFDEAKERTLIATAQGEPPSGRSRWTLHLLADRMVRLEIVEKVSYETVRKVLKKTRSTPNDRWRG